MAEFDMTWKNPGKAQVAALDYAGKHAGPFLRRANRQRSGAEWSPPLTEFMVAEMMCIAKSSLWYTQARMWSEGKGFPAPGADPVFLVAGRTILRLVDLGYSNDVWWDARQAWDDPRVISMHLASIIDVVRMLRAVRRRSLQVNSPWFEALPYLMVPGLNIEQAIKTISTEAGVPILIGEICARYDPEFRGAWLVARRAARETVSATYAPTPCIHPECDNIVAPSGIKPREGHFKNYRGTGACQKGHNSYYCTKCKSPHSFVSEIGKKHYPDYYGKDWDGTNMEGEKWRR